MAGRGPAPTPTPILKARGSWRAKQRTGEVQFPSGLPAAPEWLSDEAKAEWHRMAKYLRGVGVAQRVDGPALAAWCDAWSDFVLLSRAIAEGLASEGSGFLAKQWRLLKAKGGAADRLLKLAQQFGFTPASRVRIRAGEAVATSDKAAKFFPNG